MKEFINIIIIEGLKKELREIEIKLEKLEKTAANEREITLCTQRKKEIIDKLSSFL